MVKLLRRIFIKDYQNVEAERVRVAHGVLGAWFGIITNAILALGKSAVAIYLAQRSSWVFPMALIADAVNNFSDMGSSIVTLIGFKMAGKPADKEHPFGHQRVEYIAGLVVSTLVIAVAVTLFKDSLKKIIQATTTDYDLLSLIVLGLAILLKLFQAYVNYGLSKAINSVSLKDTALDSLMDVIATAAILVSGILSYTLGWNFLDGYMGLAVSLFVAYSGIRALKDTADPLIGQKNDAKFIEEILAYITANPRIKGVHDLICHNYGPTQRFVSLHAEVDHNEKLEDIHDVIDEIEETIKEKYGCDITIHIDPISAETEETKQLKIEVGKVLKGLDERIEFHDFRIIKRQGKTSVEFDAVIPYELEIGKEDLLTVLNECFASKGYSFLINIDHPF